MIGNTLGTCRQVMESSTHEIYKLVKVSSKLGTNKPVKENSIPATCLQGTCKLEIENSKLGTCR